VLKSTSFFWQGDSLSSRIVGSVVLSDTLSIEAPPTKLVADWERDISQHLALEAGDVESLPLARTRMRWPGYKHCLEIVLHWVQKIGLEQAFSRSNLSLMACRGARYHHDGDQYGDKIFCNLFLSEDKGLDVHFAATGLRVPIKRGTVLIFDTCQPHGVIERNSSRFEASDFSASHDCSQVFLTWELPVDNAQVCSALNITFDANTSAASTLLEAQLWYGDAKAVVCPSSGQWI
jgi:hypothetical protein